MIPKRIFYVWFGGKKPAMVNICIQNWRDKLPEYEIVELNENSPYFDFKKAYKECLWFKMVYDRRMWAYAADYVRCQVLYEYGGVYFDTDITVVKDIYPLLQDNFFAGYENERCFNGAVMGCIPQHQFMKDMVNFYHSEIFNSPLYTIPTIMTELYNRNRYSDVKLYSREYFYPFSPLAPYKEIYTPECIKENTYTIHWWSASWIKPEILYFLKNKHKYSLKKLEQCFDNAYKVVRLFNILPIAKYFIYAKEVRIGGIPVFTQTAKENEGIVSDIRLFRYIPFWKVSKKFDKGKYYLFGLPVLKVKKKD
jgi:mannosyltransferase OCH1-like enzyme